MKTLSFRDLSVGWKKSEPLVRVDTARDGISLPSGVHLIVAPNGLGKTTFLQTLAGVRPALGGEAFLDGGPIASNRNVLYVSEYLAFPKFIYPEEWIEFVARSAPAADVPEWVRKFRLEALMSRFLGRMSQGERRKVTWLAAHSSPKPIILMDEPLDGLDILAIRAARELLDTWRKQGRIVLLVAHQVFDLLDLVDDVHLIHDQKLKRLESVEQEIDAAGTRPEKLREVIEHLYLGAGTR